jgi:hypothetical protein
VRFSSTPKIFPLHFVVEWAPSCRQWRVALELLIAFGSHDFVRGGDHGAGLLHPVAQPPQGLENGTDFVPGQA